MIVVATPTELTWRERAALPLPRAGYVAGVINGRYIVAGGSYWENNQRHWTSRVDEFDPRTNAWSQSVSLPEARSDAACVMVRDTLYVFGGGAHGHARSDALALRAGEWEAVPHAALPEPRLYASAVAFDGQVYVVAGLSKPGDYASARNTFWKLTVGSARKGWESLPPLPGPGLVNAAVTVVGQRIYVFGGAHAGGANVVNSNKAYVFDCKTERWESLPDLPVSRRCWSAVPLRGKVLLIGGYTDSCHKDVLTYDLRAHTLDPAGDLPQGTCDAKFFRLGNSIIGAGGEVADGIRGEGTYQARLH